MDVEGKVVLITGASAGIGMATARRFAAAGAKLALVARSEDRLAVLAHERRAGGSEAVPIRADLRNPDQAKNAVDETVNCFGRIDILINNAGQSAAGYATDIHTGHPRQLPALNVFGPLVTMQAAILHMRGCATWTASPGPPSWNWSRSCTRNRRLPL